MRYGWLLLLAGCVNTLGPEDVVCIEQRTDTLGTLVVADTTFVVVNTYCGRMQKIGDSTKTWTWRSRWDRD